MSKKIQTDHDNTQGDDYYTSFEKSYYDQASKLLVVKVFTGDYHISTEPGEVMVTILGSCISACIRDPEIGVGGMNHFLLPDKGGSIGKSTRYGAHAMELLVNEILKRGGKRERLEVKLFGGSNITNSLSKIGDRNCDFVLDYVKREGLHVETMDLGGTCPRRIHYYADTGKVMMRKLEKLNDLENVKSQETRYIRKINKETSSDNEGDVELF